MLLAYAAVFGSVSFFVFNYQILLINKKFY